MSDAAQQEIVEEFQTFSDWTERYQYLIDLGRALPDLPVELKTDAHKLHGCSSNVWLEFSGDAERVSIRGISDSQIVSGLIALVLRVYDGLSARDILATEPSFIDAIGLKRHLSPTRANGLGAMLAEIKKRARVLVDASA
jgi:cysteine desulfuration protein SufE